MQQLRIALEQARYELESLRRECEGQKVFSAKLRSASERLDGIIDSLFGDKPLDERAEPLEGVPMPAPGN